MNENKPVRRHSNLRRFMMHTRYFEVKNLHITIIGLCLFTILIQCAFVFNAVVHCFHIILRWIKLGSPSHMIILPYMASLFVVIGINIYCCWRMVRQIRETIKATVGSAPNPVRPNVNEILPEAEVLVRASSVSDTDAKKTLLRPAAGTAENDPQTLLRASDTAE